MYTYVFTKQKLYYRHLCADNVADSKHHVIAKFKLQRQCAIKCVIHPLSDLCLMLIPC